MLQVVMELQVLWDAATKTDEFLQSFQKGKRHVSDQKIILQTRSLGALRAPTSSLRPFGPL